MARRNYRPEQIIKKLREAEVLLSQGSTVGEVDLPPLIVPLVKLELWA